MCGICGVALVDRHQRVDRSLLEGMCDAIAHRGPDDRGIFLDGPIGLGHQRLSIVDLANGHQPMSNEDEAVWLVFNGEIYNYRDYIAPLRAKGHAIRTRCDTEVLVHLHEEHHTRHLADLRGMFAFAVWDARTRTLTLARDHSGIKPLYYAVSAQGDLVFASEIKSIFASGLVRPELNVDSLAPYFALGHVPEESTLFRSIYKLPAGHVLTWEAGRIRLHRYWSLPDAPAAPSGKSPRIESMAAAFWSRFTDSVQSQLMADVPLGVFLSGGLDSSLIVAAMRALGVGTIKSFSVGFSESHVDELPNARIAAESFATDHHEVVIGANDFFEALPRLTRHRDQPLTFSASIPLYFVAALAREHVKVVLTGEGSDELFAGYGRYPRALLNYRLGTTLDGMLPSAGRRWVAELVDRLPNDRLGSRLKRSFLARRGTFEDSYLEPFAEFNSKQRRALLGARHADAYASLAPLLSNDLLRVNPLELMLRVDQATYLEELLMKQDQMSMAASIESRVPFLDHRLVEWAGTLPPDMKLKRMIGKAVVRQAAASHLPRTITEGKKLGFLVPIADWFRGIGREWMTEYAPSRDDDLLNRRYVLELLDEHSRGLDHTGRLWRILAFQVWRRQFLEAVTPMSSATRPQRVGAHA